MTYTCIYTYIYIYIYRERERVIYTVYNLINQVPICLSLRSVIYKLYHHQSTALTNPDKKTNILYLREDI